MENFIDSSIIGAKEGKVDSRLDFARQKKDAHFESDFKITCQMTWGE